MDEQMTQVKINVRKNNLKMKQRPLPWPAGNHITIREISNFYIKEMSRFNAKRLVTLYSFQYWAILKDGTNEIIANGFVREQAHFTKFWIERFLGASTEQGDAG